LVISVADAGDTSAACLHSHNSMYVKKLQFIHTVNGDGSKTAKIIKSTIDHTDIA